jgi:hypothetical protein
MSNLQKNQVSLPAFNDVVEWKLRGETLATRHVAGQPDGLRQLSALFGPERVEKINKIQERLIKDYAAASTTDLNKVSFRSYPG